MKLALGSAQFGFDYGISNSGGKVEEREVESILTRARNAGIEFIDTAHGYGSSERVLGATMGSAPFKIVTKTLSLQNSDLAGVVSAFQQSLERLKRDKVYGLLVHSASDLLGKGGEELFAGLLALKGKGQVQKLGVSVYDSTQIDAVISKFPVEIIQLPVNVLDQRLERSGHLAHLKARGIEIHARSLFLQGLLLMPLEKVPASLAEAFPVLKQYRSTLGEHGLSSLEGALLYVNRLKEVDCGVLGVCSVKELEEILGAKEKADSFPPGKLNFDQFFLDRPEILNPALWNLKGIK